MKTAEMMRTYPAEINLDRDLLARTVETLVACSQACTACADACLSEDMVAEPAQVHPVQPGLRGHLRHHRPGAVPAHRLRRQHHPDHAAGLRPGLPLVRRAVRGARRAPRALPGLRGGLPRLRAGLQRPAGSRRLTGCRGASAGPAAATGGGVVGVPPRALTRPRRGSARNRSVPTTAAGRRVGPPPPPPSSGAPTARPPPPSAPDRSVPDRRPRPRSHPRTRCAVSEKGRPAGGSARPAR